MRASTFKLDENIVRRLDLERSSQLILDDFKSGKTLSLTPELIDAKSLDDELKDLLKRKYEHFKAKVPLRDEINNLIYSVENFKPKRKGTNNDITVIIDKLTKVLKELNQALLSEETTPTDLQKAFENIMDIAQKKNNDLLKNYTKENGEPTFFTRKTTTEDITALKNLLSKTFSEVENTSPLSNTIQ